MSENSLLIAVGKFKHHLIDALGFPKDPIISENTEVVSVVLTCDTTSQSRYIAIDCFNFGMNEYAKHVIKDINNINFAMSVLLEYDGRDFKEEVDDILTLAKAGFIFCFLPNN